MARKTASELRAELEKAELAEKAATEGLDVSVERFGALYEGIVDGTPEQLIELQSAFKEMVTAIKGNWRYRGRPVMTADQREKAVAATNLSKARKAVAEGSATKEQVSLVKNAEAAKAAKATA